MEDKKGDELIEEQSVGVSGMIMEPAMSEKKPSDYDFYEEPEFTWRSALIGSLLGSIVSASNMYIGLKSGWTFGASIFGAIIGFAIMKPLSKLVGGYFGPKENCTLQTAATAAGGLSSGFVSAIPAMYQLELLPPVNQAWWTLLGLTLCSGFYGLFFAIPLRSYFIIKQKLAFPTPTASAETITSLHAGENGNGMNREAKVKALCIFWSFMAVMLYKILSFFVPFVWELHMLYWIGTAANSSLLIGTDVLWRWHLQLTGAFIGSGMLVGLNTAFSFMAGELFAFGLVGPLLFYFSEGIVNNDHPYGFKTNTDSPTLQFWFLWPGVVIMICASFTELFMNYKIIYNSFANLFITTYKKITGKYVEAKEVESNEMHKVPTWQWALGLAISFTIALLVLRLFFAIEIHLGILAIVMGFILSFIGCQSAGETDINPIGVIGKSTQFVFGPIPQSTVHLALTTNLVAGNVAASCASQTVDMIGDLKTGHLLKVGPKSQFHTQIIASLFGVVVAVVLFWLFATAYPCILMEASDKLCPFEAPAVVAWKAVAIAMTTDITKTIPISSAITAGLFAIITIVCTILKNTKLQKYKQWFPNWNAIGVAFINPTPSIPIANLIGALIAYYFAKSRPTLWALVGIAIASGAISGEGIGGVFHAIFNVAGLDQGHVATGFACPSGDPALC